MHIAVYYKLLELPYPICMFSIKIYDFFFVMEHGDCKSFFMQCLVMNFHLLDYMLCACLFISNRILHA
jgi:hypothetical protein